MDSRHRDDLHHALARLDSRGRFEPGEVEALRRVVERLLASGAALDHPREVFGPWAELDPRAQRALRRMVEREIRQVMDLYPQGEVWNALIRSCWELDRYIADTRRLRWLRGPLITLANRLDSGPLHLRNHLLRRSRTRRWAAGENVGAAAFLQALGRDPQWLLTDFADRIRVDPRAQAYYYDPVRNICVATHVGMDLMPTCDGIVCLEGNLQVGIGDLRLDIQPGNPTADAVVDAARFQGARRIVWLEGNRIPLRTWFMADLVNRARAVGIQVEIMEDPRIPLRRELPEGGWVPNRRSWLDPIPDDTLVVRRNEFLVGPDYVINHKEPFTRGLDAVFRERGEGRVRVLPQSRAPVSVPELKGDGRPNLVYKYPDSLAGLGVYFFRARDREHALELAGELDARTGEGPGVFQPFALSKLLPGGRVQDIRAEILISPLGTWFLGALRREAGKPLPEGLPDGVADAPGQLTSNMSTGGHITRVGEEEMPPFRAAALAVGDGLRTVLERTFVTGPDS